MWRLAEDFVDRGGRIRRRDLLRFGGLAAGLGSPVSVAAESAAARTPGFGRAKSVLVVFASGGQSQIDTWDPKPNAPANVRGAFSPIRTAIPGTVFCEHMPRIAKIADRLTVLRSMSHEDLDHGSAVYLTLTGQYHQRRSSNPPPRPNDLPTHGSILKRLRPTPVFVDNAMHVNAPAIIAPNNLSPGQYPGLLGRDFDPLRIGNVIGEPVVVPGLEPQSELPPIRLRRRRTLLDALEGHTRDLDTHRRARDFGGLHDRAFDLLAEARARKTFDLTLEPDAIRDRYGRNRSGQACLLARRLVEAEVPFVTVFWNHHSRGQDHEPGNTDLYGWDTHNDIFSSLEDRLLPRFDQGFSALIEDLDRRGLLETTLVVCAGEFGRAPLVALEPNFKGSSPGRKHWASAYSIALAGAGVGRGHVLGGTDRLGGQPIADRYGPWDLTATLFAALGIDPAGHYTDTLGRPWHIATGHPIVGLYS